MYFKKHDVDWNKMVEDIKAEVDKIGYTYVDDRPLSTHPLDWYLRVVVGKKKDEDDNYATWIYNDTQKGLNHGKYNLSEYAVGKNYLERV